MYNHHPTLSPSNFPMLSKCPCFVSGEVGEAAQAGTRQHEFLVELLTGSNGPFPELPEEEVAQVEWAAERVRLQTGDGRLVEERLSLVGDDFEEITFGTADIVDVVNRAAGDRLVLMDYKSGEDHGYRPQMAVYARMAMFRFGKSVCEVHELYGRRQFDKQYDMSIADTDFILDIISSVNNPDKQPSMNKFCGWCARQGDCTETSGAIVTVATEYEPDNPAAKLPLSEVATWHASQITDPRQMAIVLDVANYLSNWSDAVKAHARKAAIDGMEIPGYRLKDGRAVRKFVNIADAFNASGLEADEFLGCCTASVPDVEKVLIKKSGLKGKAAKDEFERIMGCVVVKNSGAPTLAKMEA